jgi:sulfur-oxidizing protein SoxX
MLIGVAHGADSIPPSALKVVGDGIPEPIAATPGDAARGRSLMLARDPANCLLCHSVPDAAARFAGDLGPPLAGVGSSLTIPQLRLRVADIIRLNPATIMPSYYRVDGLSLVAATYRGKPILTAAEIEDVVAYLATLR